MEQCRSSRRYFRQVEPNTPHSPLHPNTDLLAKIIHWTKTRKHQTKQNRRLGLIDGRHPTPETLDTTHLGRSAGGSSSVGADIFDPSHCHGSPIVSMLLLGAGEPCAAWHPPFNTYARVRTLACSASPSELQAPHFAIKSEGSMLGRVDHTIGIHCHNNQGSSRFEGSTFAFALAITTCRKVQGVQDSRIQFGRHPNSTLGR